MHRAASAPDANAYCDGCQQQSARQRVEPIGTQSQANPIAGALTLWINARNLPTSVASAARPG